MIPLIEYQIGHRALQKAIALHMLDPNVSHIDLGLRIREAEGHRIENELTVRVHLRNKLRGDAFAAFADKYPERVIDSKNIGFPVDIPEASYRLQYGWWSGYPVTGYQSRASLYKIMKGGISISNEWSYGFGTLGGKVRDRQTGEEMILSNWHVLVGSWNAKAGLAIYQPGRGDGGTAYDTVAVLNRDAMRANMDAAVARLTGTRELVNDQLGVGPVTGVTKPELGMVITKSGRRSRVTNGIITGINGQSVQCYGGVQRIIKNIVHISQQSVTDEISAPGDSGAWWLEKDLHRAVCLHFAGCNEPEYGLALAMPPVLDALQVEVVT